MTEFMIGERPLVIIESPFAGDIERNKIYLKRCLLDSWFRGEWPFASHGYFTHFLDDLKPSERRDGIQAGFDLGAYATRIIFYTDYAMSPGMTKAWDYWKAQGKIVTTRMIGQNA